MTNKIRVNLYIEKELLEKLKSYPFNKYQCSDSKCIINVCQEFSETLAYVKKP